MLKGRLNQFMRQEMTVALINHGFASRQAALEAEGIEMRNEAIKRLMSPAQIKAVQTLLPLMPQTKNNQKVNWGDNVHVNCAGPKIELGLGQFGTYQRNYEPIDDSIPILSAFGDLRLDLESGDPLGERAMSWASRCEAFFAEKRKTIETVSAALNAFSSVAQLTSSWPDALPIVMPILEEHLGRPAASLPAVVLLDLNMSLGLPPSNDEAAEVRELEAA
jgi:hypothetical protein